MLFSELCKSELYWNELYFSAKHLYTHSHMVSEMACNENRINDCWCPAGIMEATERYNVETRETVKIEIEAFVDLRMIFHFFLLLHVCLCVYTAFCFLKSKSTYIVWTKITEKEHIACQRWIDKINPIDLYRTQKTKCKHKALSEKSRHEKRLNKSLFMSCHAQTPFFNKAKVNDRRL